MHEQKNSSEIMIHLAFQCLLIMTGRFACLAEVGRLDKQGCQNASFWTSQPAEFVANANP